MTLYFSVLRDRVSLLIVTCVPPRDKSGRVRMKLYSQMQGIKSSKQYTIKDMESEAIIALSAASPFRAF